MPGMKRLSRSKLRALCTTDIPVLFGKTFINMTFDESIAPVTAHFSDGSSYPSAIIISPDSPRSRIRELQLGPEKSKSTPLGIAENSTPVHYNNAGKAKHVRSRSPTIAIGYHPDGISNVISSMSPPSFRKPPFHKKKKKQSTLLPS